MLSFHYKYAWKKLESFVFQNSHLENLKSSAFRRKHAVVHVLAIVHILPGYRGTYLGVCTFGVLQPTANFKGKNEGYLFSEGYLFTGFYGNFLTLVQPLCEFSRIKKKEKAR